MTSWIFPRSGRAKLTLGRMIFYCAITPSPPPKTNTPRPPPSRREYVRRIRNTTDSLLSIFNDILDFTKRGAGKLSREAIFLKLRNPADPPVKKNPPRSNLARPDLGKIQDVIDDREQ